jgi:hypothetical protein
VLPTDIQGRRMLADERRELLLRGAEARRPVGAGRRLLAGLLVVAAARLAPEAAPRPRTSR